MKIYKKIFLFYFILFFSFVNAKSLETNMLDNDILLLNEITRVGETEKWNSSLFFEGPLSLHVLKDGTVTDTGAYFLSKIKFGTPAVVKVLNLNDKNKKFIFSFTPTNQPVFKQSFNIDLKDLKENGYFYKKTEAVSPDSTIYLSPYSPKKIYKHIFLKGNNNSIVYEFYSENKELRNNLSYIRLLVYFNTK